MKQSISYLTKGTLSEIKNEDWMISTKCINCGDEVLMRKDEKHMCSICKSSSSFQQSLATKI